MRLFCFSCAGGSASFFDPLKPYLESSIDLASMEYAGHGKRRKETFYRDFGELACDMYRRMWGMMYAGQALGTVVEDQTGIPGAGVGCQMETSGAPVPYALMGYSMGSIAAVEVLRKILEEGKFPPPVHVFLAAHEPHVKRELLGFCSSEMDDMLKERTLRFGGIPDELADDRRFWEMYLPICRADYSMIGRYDFDRLALRTAIPVTVFYSEEDTPLAEMERWREYFTGECGFLRFEGDHFFIQRHGREIAAAVSERLLPI